MHPNIRQLKAYSDGNLTIPYSIKKITPFKLLNDENTNTVRSQKKQLSQNATFQKKQPLLRYNVLEEEVLRFRRFFHLK